jgi:hypothetical protein
MTGRVQDMIMDPSRPAAARGHRRGGYYGMQTFDQALFDHVKAGRVSSRRRCSPRARRTTSSCSSPPTAAAARRWTTSAGRERARRAGLGGRLAALSRTCARAVGAEGPRHGRLPLRFDETTSTEAFALQNGKLLKVSLREVTIQAKVGAMVAYQGEVKFEAAGQGGLVACSEGGHGRGAVAHEDVRVG